MPPTFSQQVQTAPLPMSGAPGAMQVATAAPDNFVPPHPPPNTPAPAVPPMSAPMPTQGGPLVNLPQFDPQLAQEAAINRTQSLAQAAENLYPQQSGANVFSVLAGIAGNIAGAFTKHGDVGESGVEYGQKLKEEAIANQQRFVSRVTEEEQRFKQEQQQAFDLQNKQLRANSMVPLINRIDDPALKADLFMQLHSGDVSGAEQRVNAYNELQYRKQQDAFNRGLKLEAAANASERLDLSTQRAQMQQELSELTKQQKQYDITNKPIREQQRIIAQESKDYEGAIQKIRSPLQDYVAVVQQLGGLESPAAQERLSRILGLGGAIRGQFLGTPEDKQLFSTLQRLFATAKQDDYGQRMSKEQADLISAGSGMTLGGGLFSNTMRNPDSVIAGLKAIGGELTNKLAAAEANKHDMTLAGFEKGGAPLTTRMFTQALSDAEKVGPVNLETTPKGVSSDVWVRMNRATRMQYFKQLKGVQ